MDRPILPGIALVVCAAACSERHDPHWSEPPDAQATNGDFGADAVADASSSAPHPGTDSGAADVDRELPSDDAASSGSLAGGGLPGSGPGGTTPDGGSAGAAIGAVGGGSIGPIDFRPPPGCRDGGPWNRAWIVDDRTFVISNAQHACGAPPSAAMRPANDCAFALRYVRYQVPTLRRDGTYEIGAEASVVIERQFPIDVSDAGCKCLPSIDAPETLSSGTIEIKRVANGRVAATINAEGITHGILIEGCPAP